MVQLGNGSHIASIATGVPVAATTAAPTAFDLPSIIETFSALDPAYLDRSSWLMAPAVKSALMQMTDTLGRSLLQADATGQPFNSLYGRPIVSSTYAPLATAGLVPIIFGDLTSYTLRIVGNLQIVRLQERYAEFNQTGFIGRVRAGGYSTLVSAFACPGKPQDARIKSNAQYAKRPYPQNIEGRGVFLIFIAYLSSRNTPSVMSLFSISCHSAITTISVFFIWSWRPNSVWLLNQFLPEGLVTRAI